jgi:hypothetical protein
MGVNYNCSYGPCTPHGTLNIPCALGTTEGEDGLGEALKGEKMTNLASISLILAVATMAPVKGFAQVSYPNHIPIAADRTGPRFQRDSHFPAEEIKFIGEENGQTHVYEDVMAKYLSPETIQEVKSRPLKWLIVRNAFQDTEYRHSSAGNVIEYPVIVDMRYVQTQEYTGVQLNGTLQAVYVVTEENGLPKIQFLKFNNSKMIEQVYTYLASAEELMRAVVGDTLNKVYGLSPETRLQ